jgi:glycosyltransferase involved in cell wall biosynthesis
MISILIPTYNYSITNLVAKLHQQVKVLAIPFEIIVCEDASTKFTEKNEKIAILSNVTYSKLTQNIGRTGLRATLASNAKYNWLLFLDADVLPKNENFIKTYVNAIKQTNSDVIFGGICYEKNKPEINKILRWKYGNEREAKSVNEREKDPYFIISQNLLIKKEVFLAANILTENYYGLDNFFSNQLKRLKVTVSHIDNPVIHFGLEGNNVFLKKALAAVETTVILEKKGLMDNNLRPLQKSYLRLKKYNVSKSFSFVISKFKTVMERNFNSSNPNLFWFDLYRLHYYIQLKKKYNA